MSQKLSNLQREAFLANKALFASGLVNFSFGNASVVDRSQGVFAIKPSGVSYKKLKPSDIVVLDMDGKVVRGSGRPSSDTPTHRLLLKNLGFTGCVMHTHSPMATAFAQAGVPLPCLGTTHADYFAGSVPVTRKLREREVRSDYEHHTGVAILDAFKSRDVAATPAVLVRSHGPFVWGEDWSRALHTALALEFCADLAIATMVIQPRSGPIPAFLHKKHYSRKHGPNAYYGQQHSPKRQAPIIP